MSVGNSAGPRRREPELNAAVRSRVLASDPATGEVGGPASVRSVLQEPGLAVAHGPRGAVYLTVEGRALREALLRATDAPQAASAEPTGFAAATGDEVDPGAEPGSPARRGELATAWAGVLETRRITGSGRFPAAWERTRMVWSVALALEAGGAPASGTDANGRRTQVGYRVFEGPTAATVRVQWRGPASSRARLEAEEQLDRCARLLAACGWEAAAYLVTGGHRYLEVRPAG